MRASISQRGLSALGGNSGVREVGNKGGPRLRERAFARQTPYKMRTPDCVATLPMFAANLPVPAEDVPAFVVTLPEFAEVGAVLAAIVPSSATPAPASAASAPVSAVPVPARGPAGSACYMLARRRDSEIAAALG